MSRLRTRRYIFLAILAFLFLFIVAVAANLRKDEYKQNITETFDEQLLEVVTPTEINSIEERSPIVFENETPTNSPTSTPSNTISPTTNSVTVTKVPTIKKSIEATARPQLMPIENQITVTTSPSQNFGGGGFTTSIED